MRSSLSMIPRKRVVTAVAASALFHQAEARFMSSMFSAFRWLRRSSQKGTVVPGPTSGDQKLQPIKAHAELILGTYKELPAIHPAEHEVQTSTKSLSRFFVRHAKTRKGGARDAAEQERTAMRTARKPWYKALADFDLGHFVSLDETTATNAMV